jgi:hypothetical protein
MLRFTRALPLPLRAARRYLPTPARFTTTAKPPPSLGTRVVDYFADNPWHFFGPLLGALALWLLRNSRGQANQDALVRALDEVCPLHAREVVQVTAANSLSAAEWEAAWRSVLAAAVAGAQRRQQVGGGAGAGAAALHVRPSEVEAALAAATGRPLRHAHALRRAAAWLSMVQEGLVVEPATDAAARALMMEREAGRAGSNWLGEAAVEAEEGAGGGFLGPLLGWVVRAATGAAGKADRPLPWHVEPAATPSSAAPSERHLDAPLPLLTVLSLYGAVAGGRGEGEESGTDSLTAMLSPSERLAAWVGMQREVGVAEAGLRGEAPPPLPPSPSPTLPHSGLAPAFTLLELQAALQLLSRTFHQPQRTRTGIVETFPDYRYALASPSDCVEAGVKEAAIDLLKSPSLPRAANAPEPTSTWGIAQPQPGVLEPLQGARDWLTADEARRALLQSRAVCLWGECNRNKAEYKGALFG